MFRGSKFLNKTFFKNIKSIYFVNQLSNTNNQQEIFLMLSSTLEVLASDEIESTIQSFQLDTMGLCKIRHTMGKTKKQYTIIASWFSSEVASPKKSEKWMKTTILYSTDLQFPCTKFSSGKRFHISLHHHLRS